MLYVLDATVAVKWLVAEPLSDRAESLIEAYRADRVRLLAPDIIHAEVGHALRKYVLGGEITRDAYFQGIEDMLGLEIPTVMCEPLVAGAAELAFKHGGSFYDALYVRLAVERDCRVLTADDRMVRAYASSSRLASLSDAPLL